MRATRLRPCRCRRPSAASRPTGSATTCACGPGVGTGLIPPRLMHTQTEGDLLGELAAGRRVAVEIGVYEGSSARVLVRRLPVDAVLHLIDPFVDSRGLAAGWRGSAGPRDVVDRAVGERGGPTVRWHVERSQEVGRRWAEPVDLVFIDGDHALASCRADWGCSARSSGPAAWSCSTTPGWASRAARACRARAGSTGRRRSSTSCSAGRTRSTAGDPGGRAHDRGGRAPRIPQRGRHLAPALVDGDAGEVHDPRPAGGPVDAVPLGPQELVRSRYGRAGPGERRGLGRSGAPRAGGRGPQPGLECAGQAVSERGEQRRVLPPRVVDQALGAHSRRAGRARGRCRA